MVYKLSTDCVVQKQSKDQIVVFDVKKSQLYTFNDTASFIFQEVKKGKKEEEIVRTVIKRFAVGEKQAQRDVAALIKKMIKQKLFIPGKIRK